MGCEMSLALLVVPITPTPPFPSRIPNYNTPSGVTLLLACKLLSSSGRTTPCQVQFEGQPLLPPLKPANTFREGNDQFRMDISQLV
jgi:hypothetical protein